MRVCLTASLLVAVIAGAALAQEEVVFKNYNLQHINLKDPEVRKQVETELRKVISESGRFTLDERSNSIIVQDKETVQNEVAKMLAKLDVGKPEETKIVTVTLRVTNVKASVARQALEEAAEKDEELKDLKISHSDETCAVILTGTAVHLEKAKAIVDALEERFRAAIETKVYKVSNRSAASLAEIVKLHIAGSPGTGVAVDEITNSLIVRETGANQQVVKQVVEKFDTEIATLLLQFKVIYASRDGEGVDESIKDVVQELRKMFDFTSYKALEGPVVKAEQGHSAEVHDAGSGMSIALRRCDYDAETGKIRIEDLKVSRQVEREGQKPSTLTISTTIKVESGHTVVIGGSSSKGAKDALIVVVKATVQK